MKIISWNVNSLKAISQRIDFEKFLKEQKPYILCLNEVKNSPHTRFSIDFKKYFKYIYWNPSEKKKGYSGTAIFSNRKPKSVELSPFEKEGRILTLEFDNIFLINTYVPNSGQKLQRLEYRTKEWDPKFRDYIRIKQNIKPVIVTGDFNVAYDKDLDIWNPKTKNRAGATPQERQNFEKLLNLGLIDTFRKFYPKKIQYTYWNYLGNARKNNKGWRIDYFLISHQLIKRVKSTKILDKQLGSDHCPIVISFIFKSNKN